MSTREPHTPSTHTKKNVYSKRKVIFLNGIKEKDTWIGCDKRKFSRFLIFLLIFRPNFFLFAKNINYGIFSMRNEIIRQFFWLGTRIFCHPVETREMQGIIKIEGWNFHLLILSSLIKAINSTNLLQAITSM